MNLPNKLTLARCILAPIFLAVLLIRFPYHFAVALLLFIVASVTDLLDGRIARSRNMVTNLGKFMDPLADKALTTFAFLGLMTYTLMGYWECISLAAAVALILAREFAVTSGRLMAAKNGKVIAAGFFGKMKTVMQMVTIIYFLALFQAAPWLVYVHNLLLICDIAGHVMLWLTVVMTVISGVQYLAECKEYFTED